MRFTDCYSANTVCVPSRYGLITGRHPGHAGIRDNYTPHVDISLENGGGYMPGYPEGAWPPKVTTLGPILKKAGYRTAQFGKLDHFRRKPLNHYSALASGVSLQERLAAPWGGSTRSESGAVPSSQTSCILCFGWSRGRFCWPPSALPGHPAWMSRSHGTFLGKSKCYQLKPMCKEEVSFEKG